MSDHESAPEVEEDTPEVVTSPEDTETAPSSPRVDRNTQYAIGAFVVLGAVVWLLAESDVLTGDAKWLLVFGVLTQAGVYAVSAMGLNVHFGYTGLLNFGQVGFMLVGAYTFVLLVPHELGRAGTASGSWPIIAAVIAAMIAAALLGLLLGGPTVRLRGDYLAIVTIAVAEILRLGARSFEFMGQSFGVIQYTHSFNALMPGVVSSWADWFGVPDQSLWLFIVTWIVVLLVFLVLSVMIHSPWGRVLRAIREDEDAARALGKNAFWYKLQSLMIGGAIGGLAGVLFALDLSQISPLNFLPLVTFFAWTVMIMGGAGTVGGPIAGSIVFWVIVTQTSELAGTIFPDWSGQVVSASRFVLMGLLIMALIVFRPQGLFGKREELSLEIQ